MRLANCHVLTSTGILVNKCLWIKHLSTVTNRVVWQNWFVHLFVEVLRLGNIYGHIRIGTDLGQCTLMDDLIVLAQCEIRILVP